MQDSLYSQPSTATSAASAGFFLVFFLFFLAFVVVALVSMWKIYTKAGKPGWASIVPFYNIYVQLEIIGRPGWWLLLLFVPVVSLIVSIMISIDLAKAFGKDTTFAVLGLILFPIIGYPILAFGDAKYVGPQGGTTPAPSTPAPTPPPAPAA